MMSPTGKNTAEMVRIRPGALSWYQVAVSVDNITAQLLQSSATRSCIEYNGRSIRFQRGFASKMPAKSGFETYPKPSKGPAMKELKNNLSHLMCVFLHPILETNSMVCWGVKASMASAGKGLW